MTGSMKWFVYTSDEGTDFAAFLDESNTESVNGGTQDYPTGAATPVFAIPRNVKPRYAVYQSNDGAITRKVVCLTPTIFGSVGSTVATITDSAYPTVTLTLRRTVGEKLRRPYGVDTGINDGDAG